MAILFADIGGSTRLYDTLGDRDARRIVSSCMDRIIEAAETTGGRVIKTIGDEVLCAFESVDSAVDAGTAIVCTAADSDTGVGVHVGIHFGPIVIEKDDVFGDTVNVAARMVGLAKDGEVLTTGAVAEALSPDRRPFARRLDTRSVRGKEDKVEIFSVVVPSDPKLTALNYAIVDDSTKECASSLTVRLGSKTITLDAGRRRATIGRQADCDLVLTDTGVSRQHAAIELRHGKFYLCDASTNGTVLCVEGQSATVLRREEAILLGSGRFGLAVRPQLEPPTPIHFEVRQSD